MRVLILGADGYLGWSRAMHLSSRGHEVAVVDNFAKRDGSASREGTGAVRAVSAPGRYSPRSMG